MAFNFSISLRSMHSGNPKQMSSCCHDNFDCFSNGPISIKLVATNSCEKIPSNLPILRQNGGFSKPDFKCFVTEFLRFTEEIWPNIFSTKQ